jgi:hypothetical protein
LPNDVDVGNHFRRDIAGLGFEVLSHLR